MKNTKRLYTERINKVVEHVNTHLHEPLSLQMLADIACFSSFHFHKIFVAITGETVNAFTNRLRLEKSARLLKYSSTSITGIALDCGFSSSSTFSRSFKQHFGISASQYKRGEEFQNNKICKELFPINEYLLPMSEKELQKAFPVTIKNLPKRRVAFIRVVDAYREDLVLKAFNHIVDWAKQMGIYETETIFGMSLDDPMVTPKEKYRYEVCLTIPDTFEVNNNSGISTMTMPACKYGVTIVSGNINMVATATGYLFNNWLINSKYEPEHQHALEIFLDKENVCNWNYFDLEICIPVKPLQYIY